MTNYTQWKSLVDLHEYSAIPDSEGTHQWDYVEGSGTLVEDQIGNLDADFTDITWRDDAGAGGFYAELDGSNDYADLGQESRSSLSHFVNDAEGTLFAWVKPLGFADDDFNAIYGGDLSSSTRTIFYGIDTRDGEKTLYSSISNGNSGEGLTDAVINFGTDEWAVVAFTSDGSTMRNYEAVGPDFDLVERESGPVPNTASGDLEKNVTIGVSDEGSQRHWNGGVDLMFTDSIARSQSELQSIVDDSKAFYE